MVLTSSNSRAYWGLSTDHGPSDENRDGSSIRNGFTSLSHAAPSFPLPRGRQAPERAGSGRRSQAGSTAESGSPGGHRPYGRRSWPGPQLPPRQLPQREPPPGSHLPKRCMRQVRRFVRREERAQDRIRSSRCGSVLRGTRNHGGEARYGWYRPSMAFTASYIAPCIIARCSTPTCPSCGGFRSTGAAYAPMRLRGASASPPPRSTRRCRRGGRRRTHRHQRVSPDVHST